ncbi:MAG: hypothetical protein AAGD05_17255, partial [Bacteroidota bacterium]
ICPTDCLESTINGAFKEENYYCSSLGNSITFDHQMLSKTKKLIRTKNIDHISFILSSDNSIVLDALGNQDFISIRGLNHFYTQVNWQKKQATLSWKAKNNPHLILSYYLNYKIKELKDGLKEPALEQLKIDGKIYHKQENIFRNIYSEFVCTKYSILN